MRTPRVMLGSAGVAAVVIVDAVAVLAGTADARVVLALCAAVAVAVAIHGVTSNPSSIGWALVLSGPPVVALLTHGCPSWLIGPLAALLLVASELASLSWEFRGVSPDEAFTRHRLTNIVRLGAVAFAAAVLVGLVSVLPAPGGTVAVVVAAVALAALARVTFASRTP